MASAAAPALPDVRMGVVEWMKGKTDAERRVYHKTPRAPSTPRIFIEHAGSVAGNDATTERARIYVHAYGNNADEARYVAYQARDVMMPMSRGPWGLYAVVPYEDPNDHLQRTVTLSGATIESGPVEAPESRNHVITSYLVGYF